MFDYKENNNLGTLAYLALLFLVIAFCGVIAYSACKPVKIDVSIAWVSAFIGIANALLLFATLRSQNANIAFTQEAREREMLQHYQLYYSNVFIVKYIMYYNTIKTYKQRAIKQLPGQ